MKRTLIVMTLALLLHSCGFVHRVWGPGGTRDQWNAYVNSDLYHQHITRSSLTVDGQTTTCYTRVDRRYSTVDTRCF